MGYQRVARCLLFSSLLLEFHWHDASMTGFFECQRLLVLCKASFCFDVTLSHFFNIRMWSYVVSVVLLERLGFA